MKTLAHQLKGHYKLTAAVASLLCLCCIPASFAQDSLQIQPIYVPATLQNVRWTSDSRNLIFHDIQFFPDQHAWFDYDTTTGTITKYDASTDTGQTTQSSCDTLVSVLPDQISPSGRLVASSLLDPYFGGIPINVLIRPGISTCTTQTIRNFPNTAKEQGWIMWSADESSFLYLGPTLDIGQNGATLVTHYRPDHLADAVPYNLRFLWIDGDLITTTAFDISADGQRVLLKTFDHSQPQQRLYIFNAAYPEESHLLDVKQPMENVLVAAFAPGNENTLWLLDNQGVAEYNLTTHQTRLLSDAVKSTDWVPIGFDPALFSPDAHHLALMTKRGLVVLDLSAEAARAEAVAPASTPDTQPIGLRRLWITTNCPTQPVESLTWTIHNPNPESVTVSVLTVKDKPGYALDQTMEVPGGSPEQPGLTSFDRMTYVGDPDHGTNEFQIAVDGMIHDTRQCVTPLKPPTGGG